MTLVASVLPDPLAEFREPLDGMAVSEEEYWDLYYEYPDRRFEWCNGRLEETGVSDFLTALMYEWFFDLLGHYLESYSVAQRVFLDSGFRLDLGGSKVSIRKPDLGIILQSNPVILEDEHHSYRGTFDLCIEALSDLTKKDETRDTVRKVKEYARVGVKEYYILHNNLLRCSFYRLDARQRYRSIVSQEGVIRSSVLEGFQFRVADLVKRPAWIDLADDPVYAGFVMKAYQIERAEKLKALQREQEERERAEAAEKEIIRLRALLEGLELFP